MTARLSQDRAQSVLKCLRDLKQSTAVPLKNFQRLPGHIASSAAVTPLGLMHMRPLQHWHTRVLRWAWRHSSHHVNITPLCRSTFSPWEDCRRALRTGVQTHYCYNRCFQDRLGRRVQRACSIRGLDRPSAALAYHLPGVVDSAFGLEEVSTLDPRQARVGPDGQHSDGCIHQPPGWCSLPSHVKTRPPSLTLEPAQTQVSVCHSNPRRPQSCSRSPLATGFAQGQVEASPPNGSADLESVRPGTVGTVCFVGINPLPVVVLLDRGSPRHGCTGSQLAQGPTQVCVSPSEPHCTYTVLSQGRQRTAPVCGPLLAQQDLVLGACAQGISSSLANSPEEGPPFSGEGNNLASTPRSLEPSCLVPGRDQEELRDLSPAVANTIK